MEHTEIKQLIQQSIKQAEDVLAINLTTVDGFSILNYSSEGFDIESDKLSAVSSSIQSLANAVSQQLIKSKLKNTIVETEDGTLIFLNTQYKNKPCVLCFITHIRQNLAKTRYFAVQLADAIANLTNQ